MIEFPVLLGIFLISFMLGSIPNGVIIGKVFYHTDIRTIGSGNIGTTNAIRAVGKVGGYAVFALDFGKGVLSGLIAWWIATSLAGSTATGAGAPFTVGDCLSVAFVACILGHMFSPWLKFHGGKGVAVGVGCLFVTFGPVGGTVELIVFAAIVASTKYVSAGSVIAALCEPILALWFFAGDWFAFCLCVVSAGLVVWAHRENIGRLRAGTERKIGPKKQDCRDAAAGEAAEDETKGKRS